MAKRTPLSQRRADDARGVDVLFGSSPAPSPDLATSGDPPNSTSPGAEEPETKAPLSKVTLYIRPDQVVAIESIQLSQRQKTGKKPDKSDLVQEALDLLVEKYGEA